MASRDVKVGIFVLASLLVFGAVVFLIGDERRLFQQHAQMRTSFKDVQGLTRGSPVRMGGLDIGRVTKIIYSEKAEDDTIFVQMRIVKEESRRIRKDSVAAVKGKGMLGDKMVVISVGSQLEPPIREQDLIQSQESQGLEQIMVNLKTTAEKVERVVTNLEKTTGALAEEEFTRDISTAVDHLSSVLESMDNGEGYVGQLLHSEEEAQNLSSTIASFRRSSEELQKLLSSTRQVVDRVRTGPGFLHQVIYSEDGQEAIAQIGGAADELALALRGVREGDSFAHGVLYDGESAKLLTNLNAASDDLAAITSDMRDGKGTIGAFLVDPSIYEDIKVMLGNVNRNRSLRALVRYSIAQDEKSGRVVDSSASQSSASQSSASQSSASQSGTTGQVGVSADTE